MTIGEKNFDYDCCVSFAGEQRKYVEEFVRAIQSKGAEAFYDNDNQHDLWGADLPVLLNSIYAKQSRYCIIFISKDYKVKDWPNHERAAASAREFQDQGGYILPVKFDDTEIDGILLTKGFIDARKKNPLELADIFIRKLRGTEELPLTREVIPAESAVMIESNTSSIMTPNPAKPENTDESYDELIEALSKYSSDVDKFSRSRPNSTLLIKKSMKKMADELRDFTRNNSGYFDERSLEITLDSLEKTAGINFVEGALEAAEEALKDLKDRLYLRP